MVLPPVNKTMEGCARGGRDMRKISKRGYNQTGTIKPFCSQHNSGQLDNNGILGHVCIYNSVKRACHTACIQ